MFRFPLWLCLAGLILPVVTLLEGLVPLYMLWPAPLLPRDWDQLGEFWGISARYGAAVGVVLGFVAIGFCLLRRGRAASAHAKRFELNLRWCLALAFFVIVANDTVFWCTGKAMGGASALVGSGWPIRVLFLFPLALATVLNLVAVVWATTRTITTDDILTPRVLMAKLRRSARVEG